jgi:TRAP-type C4-dicarboxylate transport system permease small subunit
MKFVNAIDKILASFEKTFIVIILIGMVVLSCLQIVLRNVFASGIPSTDIVLRHLTLGLAFVGASLATREEKHLRIDVIPRIISGRWGNLIRFLTYAISVLVCLIFARAGWNFVALEQKSDTLFALGIPLWIAKLIIPCGFLLIAFRMVLKMIEQSCVFVSGEDALSRSEEGETK